MTRQDSQWDAHRVVVGLSGGVDSAVAAFLLQEAGYTVHGVALDTWRAGNETVSAPERAAQVAAHLGIALVRRDLQSAFYQRVVSPFLDAYARGATPNPCVFCNPTLKFATLIEEANALGAGWIATGHYARIARTDAGQSRLLRGRAVGKDQSYALYRLDQPVLQRLRLPLGDLESKERVRDIARAQGIPSAETEDSQDLCFAVGTSYQALITDLRSDAVTPGPILTETGEWLGEHRGLPLYTVGQRSGLGVSATERLYVLRLDAVNNALIVGPRRSLAQSSCALQQVTFIAGYPPEPDAGGSGGAVQTGRPRRNQGQVRRFDARARIRYRAALTPATVELTGDDTATVRFGTPQYGVAPGQSLVLYRDDEVLGGGVIVPDVI
jgi:tRNA-specific 2-thiouridylase